MAIYFYYGTMGSSKSANLLTSAYNYQQGGKRVLYFKPELDTRDTEIKSRIGLGHQCETISSSQNIFELFSKRIAEAKEKHQEETPISAIFIDEVQFLSHKHIDEIFNFSLTEKNIPIICYGLLVSHLSELFTASKRMIENGAKLKEVKSICQHCTKKATHHLRYIDGKLNLSGDAISIEEGNITYESVCYSCYNKLSKQTV